MSSQDVQDISMASQDLSGGRQSTLNTHHVEEPSTSAVVEYLSENDAPYKGIGDVGLINVNINTPKTVNFAKQFRCDPYIMFCMFCASTNTYILFIFITDSGCTWPQYSGYSRFNDGCVFANG